MPAILLVDRREQLPYEFHGCTSKFIAFDIRTATLPEADYTARLDEADGPEDTAAVERKTVADLFASLTFGRARFIAEVERLRRYAFVALVVEGDLPGILNGNGRPDSRVRPQSIVASLLAIDQRYAVHTYFASTRRLAEVLTYRILERFCRDRHAARSEAMEAVAGAAS